MGIKNLNKLIKEHAPESVRTRNLRPGFLIIDTSYIIYKYACAIRKSGGIKFKNQDVSHVHGIFRFIINLLKNNITPVFVFDGEAPEEKEETLAARVKKDFEISDVEIKSLKKMLKFLKIEYMDAPEEADSQCAYLAKNKNVLGVYSRDTDMLMYGAPRLITEIDFKKKNMTYTSLRLVLKLLDLSYNKFVDLCILLGCDYCKPVKGIGYKTAFKLIKTKKLEDITQNKTRMEFTRAYVFKPKIKKTKLKPYSHKINNNNIIKFMENNYGFKKDNLNKMLKNLR